MRARFILPTVLMLVSAVSGQELPTRATDTLWIDSIATHSGQKAILDINFSNADTINGIDLPIKYSDPALLIDSVSFVGSRIENRFFTLVLVDTANAVCHIGAFYFDTTAEDVGPGSGLLARLHISVPDNYLEGIVTFDTTRLKTGLTFVTKDNLSYVPIFKKGYINNTYSPALDDSVWVEDIDVNAGNPFSVPVFAYNQHPLQNVRLPLEYFSDNIVFDSMTIGSTRSYQAVMHEALADDGAKKLLVSLGFDPGALLSSGSGPIAVLHFTCLSSGTSTTVVLDTTDQYLTEFHFQLGPLFGQVKTYPTFNHGTISVNLATAAGDENAVLLPREYRLEQNTPNPFNPSTSISFALPERAHVVMEVFNILGQKVRTLMDQTLSAGYHSVTFDGRDERGRPLASGIYLYVIKTAHFTRSHKMLLMK